MYDKLQGLPVACQIRLLRVEQGLTLEELAGRSGTSTPTLHRYESGWDRFEIRTLERVGAALGAGLEIRFVTRAAESIEKPSPEQLVQTLSPLFWDTDLEPSHLSDYPDWVLARVLMYGGLAQVRTARAFFGDEAVAIAATRRGTDARTRSYWATILGEPCTPGS